MRRFNGEILIVGLLLMGGLMMLGGCSHESDDIPTGLTTKSILMEEAWDEYLLGNYNAATSKFQQVLNRDATITEAYVGLGWSYTLAEIFDKGLNNFVFAQARSDFGPFAADVYAGMASNYAASNADSLSVIYARKALETEPDWTFFKDANLSARDLHVLIAQAYFHNRQFMYAKDEVDILDPNWSNAFATTRVSGSGPDTLLEWAVSGDSLSVSFLLPEAGISTIAATGSIPNATASMALPDPLNFGQGTISLVTAGTSAQTEYWTMTCIATAKKGGTFSVVGSKSGRHADYDIQTGAYASEDGAVAFTITSHVRKFFVVGDKFYFATSAAGVTFHVDQVKEGNAVYVSIDPDETNARFYKDIAYQIVLDYRYFNDYGDFVVRLMEKINSLL